jgi:hypothetical protein
MSLLGASIHGRRTKEGKGVTKSLSLASDTQTTTQAKMQRKQWMSITLGSHGFTPLQTHPLFLKNNYREYYDRDKLLFVYIKTSFKLLRKMVRPKYLTCQ